MRRGENLQQNQRIQNPSVVGECGLNHTIEQQIYSSKNEGNVSKDGTNGVESESETEGKSTNANHMVLIKEVKIHLTRFQDGRNFLIGESSKQQKAKSTVDTTNTNHQHCQRWSTIHNLSNSISDIDIINCNRLFWLRNDHNRLLDYGIWVKR